MGGYGALKLGLSKPYQYSAIGCFSLGAFMHCEQNALVQSEPVRKMLKIVFDIRDASELKGTEHDPIELADRIIREGYPKPKIFHSCGTEDASSILDAAKVTRDLLIHKPIDYIYQEGPGGHTWEYWDTWIQKYLKWIFNK